MFNPDRPRRTARRQQRGVGLIELMIGMTLGLLVIGAAIGTLVISRATSSSISDISQLQQQGSFALRVIGMQLRQTGSLEPGLDAGTKLYAFGALFPTYGTTNAAVNGIDGAGSAPDTLSIATMASQGLAETQRVDCRGAAVAAGVRMQAQFKVNSNNALTCTSNGLTEPLIDDVADFQVGYRVSTGTGIRIMNATDVNTGGLWGSVTAVEICLDLQGAETMPDTGTSYLACNGTSTARSGRVHLVFRNVFDFRTLNG